MTKPATAVPADPRFAPGHATMSMPVRPWRYFAIFLIPVLLAVGIGAGLYFFLARAGEWIGPVSAAHRQAETGELYGAALVYRPFAFKLERYRMTRPDILLVGSSRVMAFPGEAFAASVYNTGGAANNLDQAIAFAEAAIAEHRPKTILLGLDFWWFNPNRDDDVDTTTHRSDRVEVSLTQLMAPLQWLWDGEFSVREFLRTLSPFHPRQPGIGALAQFQRQGWDIHGRFDYGDLYNGEMKSQDVGFERTLKRMRNAKQSSKFNVHIDPSAEMIDELRDFVDRMRGEGIEIVLFLPPVAEPVRALLSDDAEDRLVPGWLSAIYAINTPIADFHDVRPIGSDACEFIDGFHGGEVTYLRILQAMARDGRTILGTGIDRALVERWIGSNAGHARIRELRPEGALPEVDYLQLGCEKHG